MSLRPYGRLVALLAVLMFVLAACGDGGDGGTTGAAPGTGTSPDATEGGGEPTGEPIRIGMLTSLTGPFTPWGLQVQAAMQLAAEDINAEGGIDGRPVEIVEADDQNNPEEAVAALQRMVEQDGVVAVGGIISSDVGLATARAAEQLGVPLFLVKAGAAGILSPDSQYTFRTCLPAAPMVAQPVAQYIQDQGISRVGAIIADYAWGQSVRQSLEATVGQLEGVEMQVEVAPVTEQDFTTYIRRLQDLDPEMIVATGHPPGAGPITIQATDLGLDVPVTGPWGVYEAVMSAVGPAAYGKYADFDCADYASDSYEELARRLIEASDLTWVDDDAVAAYGIVQMVRESVAEAGDDPEAIAQYLHENSFDLPGYAHPVSWTAWGELAESQPTFNIVRQGSADEGLSRADDWHIEQLFKAEPLEPFEPSE